jgi:3D (Asp-Asp-Asp) domain-containing protein
MKKIWATAWRITISVTLLFVIYTQYTLVRQANTRLADQEAVTSDLFTLMDGLIDSIGAVQGDLYNITQQASLQKIVDVKKLTVTAYTPRPGETDSDPFVTASMQRVKPGGIAVSPNLFRDGWVFGKKVYLEIRVNGKKSSFGGIYTIMDLTSEKLTDHIDIFVFEKNVAFEIGRNNGVIAALLQI